MEFFVAIALVVLSWMTWQLYRAKKFNRFKAIIYKQLKPLVIAQIKTNMENERSDVFPNSEAHELATIYYWCQYPSRILQVSLAWQLVDNDWLKKTGNVRNCQHLFFIEQDKLAKRISEISQKS